VNPNADKRISEAGLALIKVWEGYRANWYKDAVGVRTIGYGHTGPLPPGFAPPLSEEKATELLRRKVREYEECVREAVTVPLSQNAYDALVSFTFNVGNSAFCGSTLVRKLNAGDCWGAAAEFSRWVKARGRELKGLVIRRADERAAFETGCPR